MTGSSISLGASIMQLAGEQAFFLLVCLALDALLPTMSVIGGVVLSPARWLETLGRGLARRLDRARRSERTRLVRGLIATLVVVGAAAAIGWTIERAAPGHPAIVMIELFIVVMLLGQRVTFVRVRRVALALARGTAGREMARKSVAALLAPGWEAKALDDHAVARVAVETAAFGFAERVCAPLFWFLLLGLPGLLGIAAVNAIALRGPAESRFALTACRLDSALQLLPSWLAALILTLAAIVTPTANPARALRTIAADGGKHRALHRGWPVAAVAGALNLSLAGPARAADGKTVPGPWIGNGRARAEATDVRRALYLFTMACVIAAAFLAAVALLRHIR